VFNGFDCNVTVNSTELSIHNLGPLEELELKYTPNSNKMMIPIDFMIDPLCSSKLSTRNLTTNVEMMKGKVISVNILLI